MSTVSRILSIVLLLAGALRGEVGVIADYPLGEPGSLGTNSRPLDSTGIYSYSGNNYGGATPTGTDGVAALGSTHFLDTSDTTRPEGFWGPVFSIPNNDNFALGIHVRAAENTATTQGNILTTGPTNTSGALKISLTSGGWSASLHNIAWLGTTGGTGFIPNTWVHLAVIRKNGIATFYIDRTPQAGTSTGTPTFGASHLGVDSGGTSAFDGHLDMARVVTFAATDTEQDILDALTSQPSPAPRIASHPSSVSVPRGTSATFTVGATGDPAPTFQWFRNPGAVRIDGAISPVLTLPSVSTADAGDYYAVATNTLGSATSDPATLSVTAAPEPSTLPSPVQHAQMDRKYGMFCHFGVNTFVDQEWTDGTLPATTFNPTAVDADQWVRTAKAAGMRYLLLTTKHHDGFCLWNSAHTTYDVASSSRPDLDVVSLVSNACQRHGIRFAIYYSLWDRNWNNGATRATGFDMSPATSAAYLTYMKNQLTELLTNYGPVCELWLDGAWCAPNDDWHVPELYDHVKSLQPECQFSVNWTIGTDAGRPQPANQNVGDPVLYFPSDFRTADPEMPKFPDPKTFTRSGNAYYLPFEATITISQNTHWFFHTADLNAKPLSFLENAFDTATAQGNLLVVNCAPSRDGVLLPSNVSALTQLAQRLGIEPDRPFPVNLALAGTTTADSTWSANAGYDASMATDENPNTRWASEAGSTTPILTHDFGQPTTFDRVIINEFGNGGAYRCQSFDLQTSDNGANRTTIHTGTTLGESIRIDLPAAVTASRIRLRILASSESVSIWTVKVHNSSKPDAAKTSFHLWQKQNFSLAEINAGTADPDHAAANDGVPNFFKFAFGIDDVRQPYTGPGPVTFSATATGWRFAFNRAHRDVTYLVQQSADLTQWEPHQTNPGTVGQPVSVEIPPSSTPARFFRLKISE